LEVTAFHAPVIEQNDDVFEIFCQVVSSLKEEDIICIASKVVAYEQGRVVAVQDGDITEIVRQEADEVLSEGKWMLTKKDGCLICNAGVDNSNVQEGFVVLWPKNPWKWAEEFHKKLQDKFKLKKLGVVITDSRCAPSRRGVTGFALAWGGFGGIIDERGKKDLFGNEIQVTQRNVADSIADSATLLMGETNEATPFAVVREAPVDFTNETIDPNLVRISKKEDLFRKIL